MTEFTVAFDTPKDEIAVRHQTFSDCKKVLKFERF